MAHPSHAKHQSTHAESKPASSPAKEQHQQTTVERIRLRAFEICQSRKGGPGDALADWIQAEREVAAEHDVKS